eukprot:scaffold141680_cov27-Tisochrysis_lutea.AAC.1
MPLVHIGKKKAYAQRCMMVREATQWRPFCTRVHIEHTSIITQKCTRGAWVHSEHMPCHAQMGGRAGAVDAQMDGRARAHSEHTSSDAQMGGRAGAVDAQMDGRARAHSILY